MKAALIYYSRSGHTKKIADQIIATFHPDVFVVEPVNAYGNYAASVLRVIGEKVKRSSNLLATPVSDFSAYDTVFVGFPVWASTVPDFMQEYLRKADLAGKRVIPFATAGANGKDSSLKKIQELCNGSTVTDYFYTSITKPADVEKWLETLARLKRDALSGDLEQAGKHSNEEATMRKRVWESPWAGHGEHGFRKIDVEIEGDSVTVYIKIEDYSDWGSSSKYADDEKKVSFSVEGQITKEVIFDCILKAGKELHETYLLPKSADDLKEFQ